MALLAPEAFDDKDVDCIYVAARRDEAQRVEDVLSANAVDYVVDLQPFQSMLLGIFRVERDGVGFYVVAAQAELCRQRLRDAGLLEGLVDADPPTEVSP